MNLKSRLKEVFTSGDTYTVLTLLKALIDEMDGIEFATPENIAELHEDFDELQGQVTSLQGDVDELGPRVQTLENKHLYKHQISIAGISGNAGGGSNITSGAINITLYTSSSDAIDTYAKLLTFGGDYRFIASGYATFEGSASGKALLMDCYIDSIDQNIMARFFYSKDYITAGVNLTFSDGATTDTVTQII